MSQKSRIENRKKQAVNDILDVKHPIRASIIVAIFWIILIFACSGLLVLANDRDYLYNINLASFFGVGIAIIWWGLRWGFAEKILLRGRNVRNNQLGKLYKEAIPKYNLDSYRKFRNKKSYIGIIVLGSIMLFIAIVTIIIQQV